MFFRWWRPVSKQRTVRRSQRRTVCRLPLEVETLECRIAPATITGIVFEDFNDNGVYQATASTVNNNSGTGTVSTAADVPASGVLVSAYNSAGTLVAQTTTAATGNPNYTLTGLANSATYRIQFSNFPTGLYDTADGTNSATSVQFITMPAAGNYATAVDLGLTGQSIYSDGPSAAIAATSVPGAHEAAGGVVTITTTAANNYFVVGDSITIAGVGVANYNGTFTITAVPSTTTFQYTDSHTGLANSGGGTVSLNAPNLVTSEYVLGAYNGVNTGDSAINNSASPVIVAFPYSAGTASSDPGTGDNPTPDYTTPTATTLATMDQVGTTWGLATNPYTQDIYAAAYYKRFTGFGPDGTGAIYMMPWNSDNPTEFADLNTIFGAGTAGTDPHNFTTDPFDQGNANWNAVGTTSLGGMALSQDGTRLYVMDLANRTLYALGVTSTGTYSGTAYGTQIPVPSDATGVTGTNPLGDLEPFAVTYYDGNIYVGMVNSAESTQNAANLHAYVYQVTDSGTSLTFGSSPVFEISSLNYNRGITDTGSGTSANWLPWTATDQTTNGQTGNAIYPQPMLTSLTFDASGNMILGLRDRDGDETGVGQGDPTSGRGITAGDVLRANGNPTTGWTLVNSGSANRGQTNEYYYQLTYDGSADPTSDHVGDGGVLQIPGFADVLTTAFDPSYGVAQGGGYNGGGVAWLSDATGTQDKDYQLYLNNGPNFSKADGIGDLTAEIAAEPIEIGDRVWSDTDGDGLQDAGETGISGVTVKLYNSSGTLLSTATTDANGYYLFSSALTGTSTSTGTKYGVALSYNSTYYVQVSNYPAADAASPSFVLSPGNVNPTTIYSQGVPLTSTLAQATVSTSPPPANQDNVDFGFTNPKIFVWEGGCAPDDNWSDGDNWAGGVAPTSGQSDILVFPEETGGKLYSFDDLANGSSFAQIIFSGSNYDITGDSISVGAGGITDSSSSGDNTLGLNVMFSAAATVGEMNSATTLYLTGTVANGGHAITVTGAGTTDFNGVLSGTGALTMSGTGTLELDAANTYSGATTVNSGTLLVDGASALGGTTSPITVGSGTNTAVLLIGGAFTVTQGITVTGTGTVALGGTNSSGTATFSAVALSNNVTLTAASGGTVNFSGVISTTTGTTAVTATGGGTVQLTAADTYNGSTTVNQGVLDITGAGTVRDSTSFTVNAGATLELDNRTTNTPGRIATAATTHGLTLNGGTFQFYGSSSGASSDFVGALTLTSGASTVTVNAGTGGSTVLTFASASHTAGATVLFEGTNLGSLAGAGNTNIEFTSATGLNLTGGGGAVGTQDIDIVPYAVGATTATGPATSFVTYDVDANGDVDGIRPLNTTTEYQITNGGAITTGDNLEVTTGDIPGQSTVTVNSILMTGGVDWTNATAASFTYTITSGAFLSTSGANAVSSSGAGTGTIAFGAVGGIITTVSTLTFSNLNPITGTGGLTTSGQGTLTLTDTTNTFSGTTTLDSGAVNLEPSTANTGVAISAAGAGLIGEGAITINGGTLEFSPTGTAAAGTGVTSLARTITFGANGGTLNMGSQIDAGLTPTGFAINSTAATSAIIEDSTYQTSNTNQWATGNGLIISNTCLTDTGTLQFNLTNGAMVQYEQASFGGSLIFDGVGSVSGSGNPAAGSTATTTGRLAFDTSTISVTGGITFEDVMQVTELAGNETINSNITVANGTVANGSQPGYTAFEGLATNTAGSNPLIIGTLGSGQTLTVVPGATAILDNEFLTPSATITDSSGVTVNSNVFLQSNLAATSGGTLQFSQSNSTGIQYSSTVIGNIVGGLGNLNLVNSAGIYTDGTAAVNVTCASGTATYTLSGANTFIGATNIGALAYTSSGSQTTTAGTLLCGATDTLSPNSAIIMANLATAILNVNGFKEGSASLTSVFGSEANLFTTQACQVELGSGGYLITGWDENNEIYGGTISGAGTFHHAGLGTMYLSNPNNSYTGNTIVCAGSLQADANGAFGPATAAGIIVYTGASVGFDSEDNGSGYTTAEPLTIDGQGLAYQGIGQGAINLDTSAFAGPIILGSNASIDTAAAACTVSGNISLTTTYSITGGVGAVESTAGTGTTVTITTSTPNNYAVGTPITISGVGTGYNGTWVISQVLSPNSFTYTALTSGLAASGGGTVSSSCTLSEYEDGDCHSSLTCSGTISGTGGIIKGLIQHLGASPDMDALTLTGVDTYSGPTVVNYGELVVDGSIKNSAVTVNNTPATITAASQSNGTVTITAANNFAVGDAVIISGFPTTTGTGDDFNGYNTLNTGTFVVTSATLTSFTYVDTNSGSSSLTSWVPADGGTPTAKDISPGAGGATLEGTGTVGAISGTGTVSPGDYIGINSATESTSTVTITLTTPAINLKAGNTVIISGVGVAGYNGTFTVASVLSNTSFTYTDTTGLAASSGGNVSVIGTLTAASATFAGGGTLYITVGSNNSNKPLPNSELALTGTLTVGGSSSVFFNLSALPTGSSTQIALQNPVATYGGTLGGSPATFTTVTWYPLGAPAPNAFSVSVGYGTAGEVTASVGNVGAAWTTAGGTPGLPNIGLAQSQGYAAQSQPVVVASLDTGIDFSNPLVAEHVWINPAAVPASVKALLSSHGLLTDGLVTFAGLDEALAEGLLPGLDHGDKGYIDANDLLMPIAEGGWSTGPTDDIVGWNFVDNNNDPFDDNGHGTYQASILAGLDPNVLIMPVKVLDSNGAGSFAEVTAGLQFALANGAQVISDAWAAASVSSAWMAELEKAQAAGVLVITAAGNGDPNDLAVLAQEHLSNVVIVGASDGKDQMAPFSNAQPGLVDIVAPGVGITGAGLNGLTTASGTSVSTAFVAGTVALLEGGSADLNYHQVIDDLFAGATQIAGLDGGVTDGRRLDVLGALEAAGYHLPPPGSNAPPAPQALGAFFQEFAASELLLAQVTGSGDQHLVSSIQDDSDNSKDIQQAELRLHDDVPALSAYLMARDQGSQGSSDISTDDDADIDAFFAKWLRD